MIFESQRAELTIFIYSFGFGGVGRLGHAEQKDEMVPRLIKFFDSINKGVKRIFCGASFTLAIPDTGTLYLFGQNKKTGEANMYPKPVQDLAGKYSNLFTNS